MFEAVFAHPTDAMGTNGGVGGKIDSIEASFVFRKPHLKLNTRTLGNFGDLAHLEGGTPAAS